ncbi:MAG: TIGR00730 family Rossman fold protein [Spirochaetes bacterium]|nr:TIGR00730 family Rossman fold protein [Spirochaetota bacterium]
MAKLCIFCGSSVGSSLEYIRQAQEIGTILAKNGITLVYGGGNIGLMGELAQTTLDHGGRVVGVIPQKIYDMIGRLCLHERGLSTLHVVDDMHTRKRMMYDISDGFIVLPGGIGTIEEFFEVFTWYQLGYHLKPIGMLNVEGYFNHLYRFLDHMTTHGFLGKKHRDMILVDSSPQALVGKLLEHEVEYIDKLQSDAVY